MKTGTQMVEMRDGVRLATDLHFPETEGPYPVVLARSVYGRTYAQDPVKWTDRGYAFVIQDVRGLGDSEGEFIAFEPDGWGPDHTDGADTVEWIRRQIWCNGKVGSCGGSALGITQTRLAAACSRLDAQAIEVAPSAFYDTMCYQGGVWRKELCEGWLRMFRESFGEGSETTCRLWKSHPSRDSFWDSYDVEKRASSITAPGLHTGGWWDIFQRGTIRNFQTRQMEGGEGCRGNQVLVIDDSSHGESQTEDYRFSENRRFDYHSLETRFMHFWLQDRSPGGRPAPAVHFFTIGDDSDPDAPGNRWNTSDTWPPFPVDEKPYFLCSGGLLSEASQGPDVRTMTFRYDPDDPFPTLGGPNLTILKGPYDQRKAESGDMGFTRDYADFGMPDGWIRRLAAGTREPRKDFLKFTTPPLEHPVEIAGTVSVRLHVSTTAADTDFTAKLLDIYPEGDGREILLLDGILRLKFRDGSGKPAAPPAPGETAEIRIDLWDISCIFNRGHRIGIAISSSNYPRFERSPNNGDDFPAGKDPIPAENTVHTGGRYGSALLLPVKRFSCVSSGTVV